MESEPATGANLCHNATLANVLAYPVETPSGMLQLLFPKPCDRKGLLALFRGRAPWPTARDWRYGRRNPPEWALVLIEHELDRRDQLARAELERRAAEYQEAIRMLRACVPHDPAEHMRAMWRRKRAQAAEAAWERGKKERGAI